METLLILTFRDGDCSLLLILIPLSRLRNEPSLYQSLCKVGLFLPCLLSVDDCPQQLELTGFFFSFWPEASRRFCISVYLNSQCWWPCPRGLGSSPCTKLLCNINWISPFWLFALLKCSQTSDLYKFSHLLRWLTTRISQRGYSDLF